MTHTPARRNRRPLTLAVAAAAAVLVLAAGCSSTATAGGADEPAALATYEGGQTRFGESFTYGNGLVIEVKKPVQFTPTAEAEGHEGVEGEIVKIRINLINGTSKEYTPDKIGVTVESAGVEAAQVVDPGSRIEFTGPTRLLDRGDVAAFDLAYVVADADDVTVTVEPALAGYDPLVVAAR